VQELHRNLGARKGMVPRTSQRLRAAHGRSKEKGDPAGNFEKRAKAGQINAST